MLEALYAGATEADNVFDRVTHIVVFHNDRQTIPERNIIRSLGGQPEQDMVRFSNFLSPGGVKINIVYHDWLDACLKAKKVLPVQDYDALP
ncbi:hypothetical protein KC19_VG235100 [Ceratodon purpureus]|uniref:BRCT domain-containing protein n=1 Tax=Ceratodon purpureus TaxID=3225 RepID=A0A8T0HSV1_CERPU|nr:hypothetical protein KC19_VG235100 [Ceratodon purpureus]